MDCLTTICLLLFGSCQFALTTSSAPQLTVVGGFSPVYSCPGEQVTLRCTWNPLEAWFGGWDMNGTQHTLQELNALKGHTTTAANGQVNVTITSSRTSTTTYSFAVTLLSDNSVTLRSNPTIVKYDDSSVELAITHTRSNGFLSITVRVQHRGCTDPIDTVIVSINSTVTEGKNLSREVVSNEQDLDPCVFGGLSQNLRYKITIMTRTIGGSFSEYQAAQPMISMPRNEDDAIRDNTELATNTIWIIVGAVIGAVLLLSVLIVVALSGGVLFIRCAKHKPANSPDSDKPSSDQMYSVPDVRLEPSPAYATVEGTSQGKSLYMNV